MSEYRIGLITEGVTDQYIIEVIVRTLLPRKRFVFTHLSPTETEIMDQKKKDGFGWGGVYRVCKQLQEKLEIAKMADSIFDLIIIHIDGDVMMLTYDSTRIIPMDCDGELPCYSEDNSLSENCRNLRSVVESWNEAPDQNAVYCIPYINTDAWAAYMLYPSRREEFNEDLDKDSLNSILLSMGKKEGKLIRKDGRGIKKLKPGYLAAADRLNGNVLTEMRAWFTQLNLFCDDIAYAIFS